MRCRICGCSETNACVRDGVPCHWVEPDLCSACATATGPTTDAGPEILAQTKHPHGRRLQLDATDMLALQQMPALHFEIGPAPALDLLSALQLASRHPELPARLKHTLTEIGEGLQEYLSVTPNLAAIAAAGWDEHFDLPAEPERRIILPGEF